MQVHSGSSHTQSNKCPGEHLTDRDEGGADIDSASDDGGQQSSVLVDGLEDDGCVEHDTVDACTGHTSLQNTPQDTQCVLSKSSEQKACSTVPKKCGRR